MAEASFDYSNLPDGYMSPAMQNMLGYNNERFIRSTYNGVRSFHDFVQTFGYELFRVGLCRSVADFLSEWLTHGEAVLYCPTFEIYLKTVIEIISTWNGEIDQFTERSGLPSLLLREPGIGQPDGSMLPFTVPTIIRPDSEVDITNHPAFDRTTYELTKAWAERPRTMKQDPMQH